MVVATAREIVVGEVRAVADPAGNTPTESVRLQRGVALLGLPQQPDLVPSVTAEVAAEVLVRRLRAVRRLRVTADLHFQHMQVCTKVRLEQQVEDVRLLLWRVVDKQP